MSHLRTGLKGGNRPQATEPCLWGLSAGGRGGEEKSG